MTGSSYKNEMQVLNKFIKLKGGEPMAKSKDVKKDAKKKPTKTAKEKKEAKKVKKSGA